MAQSRRDKLNALNQQRMNNSKPAKSKETTIVDEMLESYSKGSEPKKEEKSEKVITKAAKKKEAPAPKVEEKKPVVEEKTEVVEPASETPVAAPADEVEFINVPAEEEVIVTNPVHETVEDKYGLIHVMDKSNVGRPKKPGEHTKISATLKMENYAYAKINSGKYGGLTGYLNYLIEQDMLKNS